MKTAEEIEDLKRQWRNDPCWDIYETEGFEEHKEELFKFQESCQSEWDEREAKRLKQKSIDLGIEGNIKLLNYVELLEHRLIQLEKILLL